MLTLHNVIINDIKWWAWTWRLQFSCQYCYVVRVNRDYSSQNAPCNFDISNHANFNFNTLPPPPLIMKNKIQILTVLYNFHYFLFILTCSLFIPFPSVQFLATGTSLFQLFSSRNTNVQVQNCLLHIHCNRGFFQIFSIQF